MSIEFKMPSLGPDMADGIVTEWRVKPGSAIKRGQVIVLVETEKGIIDVEAFHDDIVERLLVEPGARVPVGTPLALLKGKEEAVAAGAATAVSTEAVIPAQSLPPARTGAGIQATVPPIDAATAMRHAIATSMARSKREIPHYYLAQTLDFEPARAWLENFNAARPVEDRLLYPALIVKAVARAAAEVPGFNGYYREERFQPAQDTHIGFAVAQRGGGLVAPGILEASNKDPPAIMRELKDLVSRARTGHLRSSELSLPTITITSLGEEGVDTVYPIIFPDQVAIIGVGRPIERPWLVEGKIVPRVVLTITLAADHRVSDGRAGAKFLSRIAILLSAPSEL